MTVSRLAANQLRHLDLPQRLHLAQDGEHRDAELAVLQQVDDLGGDPAQQALLLADPGDVDVERAADLLGGQALVDRLADHVVLLDGAQPVDLLVVGVALVGGGDETMGLGDAQPLQHVEAQVAVEEQVAAAACGCTTSGSTTPTASIEPRMARYLRVGGSAGDLAGGEDLRQRQHPGLGLEGGAHLAVHPLPAA